MTTIKLIALDMDGTLLNDEEMVTDYTREVIHQAISQGVQVVLSTGRPLETCISYAEDLQLSSYLITSNGAEIFDENQTLVEQHVMEPDIIEKMWSIAHEHNIDTWMVATDAVFIRGKRPSNFTDHTWLKFGYGELDEVHKLYVLEQLKQLGPLEITNSSLVNLEVNLKGVHKASAIHSLCNRLGLTMDQVLAVGDSLNDFQMLIEAGIGVAMGNAQDVIIDAADAVTDTNNEDGVAKAIEKFVLH